MPYGSLDPDRMRAHVGSRIGWELDNQCHSCGWQHDHSQLKELKDNVICKTMAHGTHVRFWSCVHTSDGDTFNVGSYLCSFFLRAAWCTGHLTNCGLLQVRASNRKESWSRVQRTGKLHCEDTPKPRGISDKPRAKPDTSNEQTHEGSSMFPFPD